MIWLAAIGGGSFVLVSLVLGPRLLVLGRSRRQLPEFTMGLCLLLMGALGYPFATVGRVVTALPDDVRGLFLGCSALCNTVGFAALAIFTWRVFRPRSGLVEVMMAACITALALLVPAEAVWPGLVESALSAGALPRSAGLPARGGGSRDPLLVEPRSRPVYPPAPAAPRDRSRRRRGRGSRAPVGDRDGLRLGQLHRRPSCCRSRGSTCPPRPWER